MKRRQFIKNSLVLGGATLLPYWPSRAWAASATNQVIYVFLRGGCDPLGILQPKSTSLASWRPNLLIKNPIDFAGMLLHPSFDSLKKDLGFALNTGSLNKTRSHFIQQDLIETGSSLSVGSSGFLNRATGVVPTRKGVAVGTAIPKSFLGANQPTVLSTPDQVAPNFALDVSKPMWSRSQRLGLYQNNGSTEVDTLIHKAASQAQTEYTSIYNALNVSDKDNSLNALLAASNYTSSQFGKDLATAAAMLTIGAQPAFVAVNATHGWDTHANQASSSVFDSMVTDLASNLAALKRDLVARYKWATTVVIVMSEFGRTVGENASLGSDHGEGGFMMLMGGNVKPFKLQPTSWTIPATINSSTALEVKVDYRLVVAEVLAKHMSYSPTDLKAVFPELTVFPLMGLFKT